MKSVVGMIVVFLGLSVILYYNIFGLFAQSWMLYFSLILTAIMLIIVACRYGLPFHKKGESNDKT